MRCARGRQGRRRSTHSPVGAADMRAVLAVMASRVPNGAVNRDVLDRPGWQARLSGYARRFGDG